MSIFIRDKTIDGSKVVDKDEAVEKEKKKRRPPPKPPKESSKKTIDRQSSRGSIRRSKSGQLFEPKAGDKVEVFHRASTRLIEDSYDDVFGRYSSDLQFPVSSAAAACSRPKLFETHGWTEAVVENEMKQTPEYFLYAYDKSEDAMDRPMDGVKKMEPSEIDGLLLEIFESTPDGEHLIFKRRAYVDVLGCNTRLLDDGYECALSLMGTSSAKKCFKYVYSGIINVEKGEEYYLRVPKKLESQAWFWCEGLADGG